VPDIGNLVRHTFLALVGALLFSSRASAEDSYLLALTWQPGFCADQAHAALAECKIAAKDRPRLVLHGLWPDWDVNRDGKRNAEDDFCVSGAANRKAIIALDSGSWLKLPPVKLSEASSSDLEGAMPGTAAGLERHEWWKHGTCSDLAAEDYFATAIVLMRQVERGSLARLLVDQAGGTLDRRKLLEAFALDFGRGAARALILDCSKNGGETALTEIRLRLKRSSITQGLTAESLAIPAKPARGDCAAEVLVPAWPR
jgi:ribonuclease T2